MSRFGGDRSAGIENGLPKPPAALVYGRALEESGGPRPSRSSRRTAELARGADPQADAARRASMPPLARRERNKSNREGERR
jgi:hypothetical protein